MSIQLTIMSLDLDSTEEPITKTYEKDEVFFGRSSANDVVLNRPEVSSMHAVLKLKTNGGADRNLYVMDLGSSNGTLAENNSLPPKQEVLLLPNQRIIIGTYLIKPTILSSASRKVAEPLSNFSDTDSDFDSDSEEQSADFNTAATTTPSNMVTRATVSINLDGSDVLDLNFEARELFNLRGKVLHQGKPLSGVKVDGADLGSSVTGADGSFEFKDIAEGSEYKLTASREGFNFDQEIREGILAEDAEIIFGAIAIFNLSGIVEHKGKPLAGVTIDGGSLGSVTSSSDGRFVFENIPEETEYTLNALRDNFIFESENQQGKLIGEESNIRFRAIQLFNISGRVIHKGVPMAGVEIDAGELGKTHTDAQGNYLFERVPEGKEYTLVASKDGFIFGKMKR